MAKDQMSQEDFAVVKLAAAERYRERNIRPETASYLFDRTLRKQAASCGSKPAAKVKQPVVKKTAAVKKPDMGKITKLASALKRTIPAKKKA